MAYKIPEVLEIIQKLESGELVVTDVQAAHGYWFVVFGDDTQKLHKTG